MVLGALKEINRNFSVNHFLTSSWPSLTCHLAAVRHFQSHKPS